MEPTGAKYIFNDLNESDLNVNATGNSSFLLTSTVPRPTVRISEDTPHPTKNLNEMKSTGGISSNRQRACPSTARMNLASAAITPGMPQTANIIALVEGRGLAKGQIGMASLDVKRPELILSQFPDTQTYARLLTKLNVLQPREILIPVTLCQDTKISTNGGQIGSGAGTVNSLYSLLTANFSNTNIESMQRKLFNENVGLELIRNLCVQEFNSVIEIELTDKYYSLACAAALLKYIECIQNISFAKSSLKVSFKGFDQSMMIDPNSVKHLELIVNSRDPRNGPSLFKILNYTKTVPGSQMLRSNILQPSCSIETIEMRLNCIEELTEKPQLFYALQGTLDRFIDVNRLLAPCVQIPRQESPKTADTKISYMIQLKHVLELVCPLRSVLEDCEAALTKAYCQGLADNRFIVIIDNINKVVHEDTRYAKGALNFRIQKCFAIKPGINGMLDVARRTYTEIVDDISNLIQGYSEQYQLPLRSAFTASKDFHIQLNLPPGSQDIPQLPPIFFKVVKCKNRLLFTTQEILQLNNRVNQSLDEIYLMSNVVLSGLMEDIRANIGCLYKLAEIVATLDMIVSLAHFCTLGDYKRPEFTDTLAIKQGRHPILEKTTQKKFVANDVYSAGDIRMAIITGPNMSGKSTYLCQIALLHILAQIGCFVPAEYASFRMVDHIFTRMGSSDDIETNTSSFTNEMKEMNYILQNVTDNSIVLVDELCKNTAHLEGVGLCYGICEELLTKRTSTFFVTHFSELTELASLYHVVENYNLQVEYTTRGGNQASKSLVTTHKLKKGKCQEINYGLQLAELTSIPIAVTQEARMISGVLNEKQIISAEISNKIKEDRITFKLAHKLLQVARNSTFDEDSLKNYLKNLKQQYLDDLRSLSLDQPMSVN